MSGLDGALLFVRRVIISVIHWNRYCMKRDPVSAMVLCFTERSRKVGAIVEMGSRKGLWKANMVAAIYRVEISRDGGPKKS